MSLERMVKRLTSADSSGGALTSYGTVVTDGRVSTLSNDLTTLTSASPLIGKVKNRSTIEFAHAPNDEDEYIEESTIAMTRSASSDYDLITLSPWDVIPKIEILWANANGDRTGAQYIDYRWEWNGGNPQIYWYGTNKPTDSSQYWVRLRNRYADEYFVDILFVGDADPPTKRYDGYKWEPRGLDNPPALIWEEKTGKETTPEDNVSYVMQGDYDIGHNDWELKIGGVVQRKSEFRPQRNMIKFMAKIPPKANINYTITLTRGSGGSDNVELTDTLRVVHNGDGNDFLPYPYENAEDGTINWINTESDQSGDSFPVALVTWLNPTTADSRAIIQWSSLVGTPLDGQEYYINATIPGPGLLEHADILWCRQNSGGTGTRYTNMYWSKTGAVAEIIWPGTGTEPTVANDYTVYVATYNPLEGNSAIARIYHKNTDTYTNLSELRSSETLSSGEFWFDYRTGEIRTGTVLTTDGVLQLSYDIELPQDYLAYIDINKGKERQTHSFATIPDQAEYFDYNRLYIYDYSTSTYFTILGSENFAPYFRDADYAALDWFGESSCNDNIVYIGSDLEKFSTLTLYVDGAGSTAGGLVFEYWNGSSWTSFTPLEEGTNDLANTGECLIILPHLGDWAKTTVRESISSYYIRITASGASTSNTVSHLIASQQERFWDVGFRYVRYIVTDPIDIFEDSFDEWSDTTNISSTKEAQVVQTGRFSIRVDSSGSTTASDTMTRDVYDLTQDWSGWQSALIYAQSTTTGDMVDFQVYNGTSWNTIDTITIAAADTWELHELLLSSLSTSNQENVEQIRFKVTTAGALVGASETLYIGEISLFKESNRGSNNDTLDFLGASGNIVKLFYPTAKHIEDLYDMSNDAANNRLVSLAEGYALDLWGRSLGLRRWGEEADVSFRGRLKSKQKFTSGNRVAIIESVASYLNASESDIAYSDWNTGGWILNTNVDLYSTIERKVVGITRGAGSYDDVPAPDNNQPKIYQYESLNYGTDLTHISNASNLIGTSYDGDAEWTYDAVNDARIYWPGSGPPLSSTYYIFFGRVYGTYDDVAEQHADFASDETNLYVDDIPIPGYQLSIKMDVNTTIQETYSTDDMELASDQIYEIDYQADKERLIAIGLRMRRNGSSTSSIIINVTGEEEGFMIDHTYDYTVIPSVDPDPGDADPNVILILDSFDYDNHLSKRFTVGNNYTITIKSTDVFAAGTTGQYMYGDGSDPYYKIYEKNKNSREIEGLYEKTDEITGFVEGSGILRELEPVNTYGNVVWVT